MTGEFDAVEARLWAILEPYREGKTTFNFTAIDDVLFAELETLTGRAFKAYEAAHA